MAQKRKSQILQPSFFWLFFLLCGLPAHANNVDFSNFSASCSQMRSSLAVTERKINALRLSDKKFLRIQLAEYQALSRIKTSGASCKKIKKFFGQQASNTRNALRSRASSSSARATKMQAQLNAFVSDMETLQVVLGAVQVVLGDVSEGPAQNTEPTTGTGSGVNLANVSIGQNLSSVSLSGRCGLPAGSVTESKRRAWYNESIKGNGTSGAWQNDSSARAEIMSISTPVGFSSVCEAAGAQVYAFLPSLNQAITADKRLHNGNGVGLRCGASGGSGASACAAVNITYGLMTASYQCQQVCGNASSAPITVTAPSPEYDSSDNCEPVKDSNGNEIIGSDGRGFC